MSAKTLTYLPNTISVYIHWPYCVSKCPYCDFNSYHFSIDKNEFSLNLWKQAYINEINKLKPFFKGKEVKTLFFGGGTPSLMPVELVNSIIQEIIKINNNKALLEITLESNPSSVEISKFKAFKELGVNRISIGVQSFNDGRLKFLGRTHTQKKACEALEIANNIFNRVSFDLINGLPKQNLDEWKLELKTALPYIKTHISIYELTIEEGTPFFKQNIPAVKSELGADMLSYTIDFLSRNNIYPYEISNYAKPKEESLHNLQYWQGGLYVGIGAGAHGRLLKNDNLFATMSYKNPRKWLNAALNNKNTFCEFYELTNNQRLLELLILNLRLYQAISNLIIPYIKKEALELLVEKKLLIKQDDSFYVSTSGRLKLNSLISFLSNNLILV